jgi:hypothetical protein
MTIGWQQYFRSAKLFLCTFDLALSSHPSTRSQYYLTSPEVRESRIEVRVERIFIEFVDPTLHALN